MPKASQTDIIFTGFSASGSVGDGLNIDETGESESNLDLNTTGEYQDAEISLGVLKTMVSTVLAETHYFTPAETRVLLSFQAISPPAQHLFVFLAIHPKWHRLHGLQSVDAPQWGDITCAIAELCRPFPDDDVVPKVEVKCEVKEEPTDHFFKKEEDGGSASVWLKKEEPCEVKLDPVAGPSDAPDLPMPPSQPNAIAGPSTLFPSPRPDPRPTSLCINDSTMTLRQLVEYMDLTDQRKLAKDLKIPPKKKLDLVESILTTSSKQTNIMDFFGGKGKAKATSSSQEERLREMILKKLKKLIRIDPRVFDIFIHLHLRYFRPTELPTEVIPRSLRHLRRGYPDYVCKRTEEIWKSREMLIEYHDALAAEAKIAGVLPSGIQPDAEPSPTQAQETQLGKRKRPSAEDDETDGVKDKKAVVMRKAQVTRKLFEEVIERWAPHNGLKGMSGPLAPGLERFDPGYVLTRAIYKGGKAFKVLQEPDSELEVLDILLKQQHWCRGLRGAWHLRRSAIRSEKTKNGAAGKAIEVTLDGIQDLETCLIYRPPLIRNLTKLEKRLEVEDPTEMSEPNKVPKISFSATRIPASEKKQPSQWKAKDYEQGSIQALVCEHYEKKFDFERVQPGGPLLTTLFTLLFWDIIFMPVEGAFETPFQTCPLDLCEDTFLSARQDAIDGRLNEMRAGRAVDILKKHDAEHRVARKTVVGVRWDLCSRKHLVEIVKCMPGEILDTICKMFCENYLEACLGCPDLIAWDAGGAYKLVHIVGPGYPSRQSKKAWRDVLARGAASQEICEVVDIAKAKEKEKKKKQGTGKGKGKKKATADSGSEDEDDELEAESEKDEEESFWQPKSKGKASRSSDSGEEDEDDYQPKNAKRRKAK
ncbi:hypothetical protein C8R46DRAFT_1084252 [Mycena filopes]|nr:hypothetical protein C8R46DRAFT_1084252 [Mycena filopes]